MAVFEGRDFGEQYLRGSIFVDESSSLSLTVGTTYGAVDKGERPWNYKILEDLGSDSDGFRNWRVEVSPRARPALDNNNVAIIAEFTSGGLPDASNILLDERTGVFDPPPYSTHQAPDFVPTEDPADQGSLFLIGDTFYDRTDELSLVLGRNYYIKVASTREYGMTIVSRDSQLTSFSFGTARGYKIILSSINDNDTQYNNTILMYDPGNGNAILFDDRNTESLGGVPIALP